MNGGTARATGRSQLRLATGGGAPERGHRRRLARTDEPARRALSLVDAHFGSLAHRNPATGVLRLCRYCDGCGWAPVNTTPAGGVILVRCGCRHTHEPWWR